MLKTPNMSIHVSELVLTLMLLVANFAVQNDAKEPKNN